MNKTKLILILIITLFLEIVVFNITSYRTWFSGTEKIVIDEPEYLYTENGTAFYKIDDINKEVVTFKVDLKPTDELSEYRILYSDETSSEYFGLASKVYLPDMEESKYYSLFLSGNVNSIILEVKNEAYFHEDYTEDDESLINEVVLNENIPIEFNVTRFISVFVVLLFVFSIKYAKVFKEDYSTKNFKQEIILITIVAVFFILASFINSYSSTEPTEEGVNLNFSTTEGIYNKDFIDALREGKFYLNHEPSEAFKKLENPYDAQSRGELNRNYDYLWDTAYYDGHFYIYFGILPALMLFLPFNIITGSYLKISVVVYGFSILIFILLKEILLKLISKYFDKISFKNVVYFLIILCSGTLILYANGMSRFYEIVIVAGLYFVLQGIYFIIKASEDEKLRHLNIFLGSTFLALSVACRPTDLLASILIVPYLFSLLLKYIKDIKNNKKNLIKLIIAVAIPYVTVGSMLMWYNYVRFGNVFEFGAKYQLTINNMMTLGSRLFAIPVGLMCNLFAVPKFVGYFPFISHTNDLISFYGYYYIENMIGGLFMIAPICFFIFMIFKFNKKMKNKELKVIVNVLTVVGLILAVMSVMMAGSNQRYLIDYAWMLIMAGILIFAGFYSLLKSDESKKILQCILSLITVYTLFVSISAGILSEKEQMKSTSPEEYYKTKYTVCFWE